MEFLSAASQVLAPLCAAPVDLGRGLAIAITVALLVLAIDRLRSGPETGRRA
jgi:hypothetical protein